MSPAFWSFFFQTSPEEGLKPMVVCPYFVMFKRGRAYGKPKISIPKDPQNGIFSLDLP